MSHEQRAAPYRELAAAVNALPWTPMSPLGKTAVDTVKVEPGSVKVEPSSGASTQVKVEVEEHV